MKKRFRFCFTIASFAVAAALLTGCHGKKSNQPDETVSPSDTQTVADRDYQEYLEDYVDTSAMSFEEIGKILGDLSISVNHETLQKAENSWNQLDPDEIDFVNKVGYVLSYVGKGTYDNTKKTFVPSSDEVYCFDLENGASDQALETFFDGLNAIGEGQIAFSDVKLKSVSKEDKESGVYRRNIKFKLNGKPCSYNAEIFYDWFDVNLISYINSVLKKQGDDNRLYYMEDNSNCVVFYCSEEWAQDFARETGCELMTEMP